MTLCDYLCDFIAMRRDATKKDNSKAEKKTHRKGTMFNPVLDSRKRKVRGLVERNGRYYAQMRLADPSGKSKAVRIPLDSTRLDHAIAEAEKKRTEKRGGEINLPGVRPNFSKLVEQYLASNIGTRRNRGKGYLSKSDSTRRHEKQSLDRWITQLGGKRIDWIEEKDLMAFVNKRTAEGVTNRTINLDLTAFNNAMTYAKMLKLISQPTRLEKQIEGESEPKRLLSTEEIQRLVTQATTPAPFTENGKGRKYHAQNGLQLALFIRFLASSGCREQEALKIKKADVDMDGKRLTLPAKITKSGKPRTINFNPALGEVLKEILEALGEATTQWLFPSPRRGKTDRPADSLRSSFNMIRLIAGLPEIGFHHFRHYFISECVMQGTDYLTIAKWVGHQDGGVLIGKRYGHLREDHMIEAAAGLKL